MNRQEYDNLPRGLGTGKDRAPVRTRAGTAERDAVITRIGDAFAGGYLTREEADERLSQAMHAMLADELRPLVEDLPGPPPPAAERWKSAAACYRDSVHFWLAGIPAGLLVMVVPVSVIATFGGRLSAARSTVITVTLIIGLYILIISVVQAVEAHVRKEKGRF